MTIDLGFAELRLKLPGDNPRRSRLELSMFRVTRISPRTWSRA